MLCPRFSQALIPSGKKDGDCLVHGLLLPTSTLGWREKRRACNPEGNDSELSRMAVAHLAQNWDGWVFLQSNNSLMLVLQVLSAPTCSRMKPGLPWEERRDVKDPLLSCGQQDLGSDNPHGEMG